MNRRPPRSTRTGTLLPNTTVSRSPRPEPGRGGEGALFPLPCRQAGLGGGQAGDRHPIGRAAPIIQPGRLAERDRSRIAAVLAADADLEISSAEHTSELPSLMRNSYAIFCLKHNNTSRTTNKH